MTDHKMSVPEILRKAAEVMLTGGYVKGIREAAGAHCALGAIDKVTGRGSYSGVNEHIVKALSDMLPEKLGGDPYNYRIGEPENVYARVATWNNMHCNSAEDVACVMRATAEYLEEEEEASKTQTLNTKVG